MQSLLMRALTHPFDYIGVLKKHGLSFIEHVDEGNGVHTFVFLKPTTLSWKPGQHAVFTLPRQEIKGKKWRAFSIASTASEEVIRIGTNCPDNASDFKKKLLQLQPGDVITMYGPFGEFHASAGAKDIVGIAGGIGITPFRSIMQAIVNEELPNTSLLLIYAGKDNYFPYLEKCQTYIKHPNIDIIYVNTPEEVNREIDQAVQKKGNEASYFLSGSPGMLGALRTRLKKLSITKIVNDPFKGY